MANLSCRILVVDDDALSRELLSLLLGREGYAVGIAESGDAACAALVEHRVPVPECVLVDLQMPGTAGSALARRLREICGDRTRIIAMSASNSSFNAVEGFDAFLTKPFDMETLATAMTARLASPGEPIRQNVTVLDQTVYNTIANSMRPEAVDQLYALCLSDALRRVTALRQAASRGDDAAFRREAHSLKGGCGMVGAVELQMIANTMEEIGIPANYVATLDEFLLACDRLERMLVARKTVPDRSSVTAKVARRSHA